MLEDLSSLSPAEGASRVYYAGQKEQEAEEECRIHGIPLEENTWEIIVSIAKEFRIPIPETRKDKDNIT